MLLSLSIFQDAGDSSAATPIISVATVRLLSSPGACLRARKGLQSLRRKLKGPCTFLSKEEKGGGAQEAILLSGLSHLERGSWREEKSIEYC